MPSPSPLLLAALLLIASHVQAAPAILGDEERMQSSIGTG